MLLHHFKEPLPSVALAQEGFFYFFLFIENVFTFGALKLSFSSFLHKKNRDIFSGFLSAILPCFPKPEAYLFIPSINLNAIKAGAKIEKDF